VLFGTAFLLKHLLLASLYAPEGSWLKRLAGVVLEGVTLGTLEAERFAPATGYISFFTLALYVASLILLSPQPEPDADAEASQVVKAYRKLDRREQILVRAAMGVEPKEAKDMRRALSGSKDEGDLPEEETVVVQKPER
jgi:hypothetical protein